MHRHSAPVASQVRGHLDAVVELRGAVSELGNAPCGSVSRMTGFSCRVWRSPAFSATVSGPFGASKLDWWGPSAIHGSSVSSATSVSPTILLTWLWAMSVLTFVSGLPGLALAKGLPPRRQRAAPSLASRQQPIGDDLGPEHARRVVHVEQVDLRHTVTPSAPGADPTLVFHAARFHAELLAHDLVEAPGGSQRSHGHDCPGKHMHTPQQ